MCFSISCVCYLWLCFPTHLWLLTLHHAEGILHLGFEQVHPHHCGQVLHTHLIHLGVLLDLEQKPAGTEMSITRLALTDNPVGFKVKQPCPVHNAMV